MMHLTPTRRKHLEAMAADQSSPREAAIALRKLGRESEALWKEHLIWRAEHVETFCPQCKHSEFQHVAGQCYTCGPCGWTLAGAGAYSGSAGWHRVADWVKS